MGLPGLEEILLEVPANDQQAGLQSANTQSMENSSTTLGLHKSIYVLQHTMLKLHAV